MFRHTLFILLMMAVSCCTAANAEAPATQPLSLSSTSFDSIQSLFSGLSLAQQRHNYQSLLTYEANGFMATFKLSHHMVDCVVHQQLTFMDGLQRQVIRKQRLKGCRGGETRWGVWPVVLPASALGAYRLKPAGNARVAGRQVVLFDIMPTDTLRYGYRYSVDQETGLLLKVSTLYQGVIIERLQTVSINVLAGVRNRMQEDATLSGEDVCMWRVPEVEPCQMEQFQSAWRVSWLPEGFRPVGNRVTAQGEQVLIFADGLVSFSVFIVNGKAGLLSKATARNGAMVVVMSPLDEQSRVVAVVGEVPVATDRRIAVSVVAE